MKPLAHYFVTDIECDGPDPARNSMLSFATVVLREDGAVCGEFEAVLAPRADRAPNARTMQWWAGQPEAWEAATRDPQDAATVMNRYAEWVCTFPGPRSFAARPLMFDGLWMDAYLRAFTDAILLDVPYWGRCIFDASPLDIGTYMLGVFGRTAPHTGNVPFPAEWLGNHPHTHRAIDDARGYASMLARLLALARRMPPHPEDFSRDRGDSRSDAVPETATKED